MYAVIETGGKQYRVEVGTELAVELLDAAPGESVTLDRVLLVADGDDTSVGRPLVDGATVAAEVVRLDRADKVVAFKYRPKARRRVKHGHRQEQTILRVTDVVVGGRSAAEERARAEDQAKTERERLEEAAARQAAADAALAAKLAEKAAPAEASAETTEPSAPVASTATTESAAPAAAKRARAKAAPGTGTTADAAGSSSAAAEPQATAAESPAATKKTTRAKATPADDESAKAAPKRARTKKDE
ncbi:MAG TPA: 50S ribosomal protein L21 [Candidatus Limnocylindrales bacterium]